MEWHLSAAGAGRFGRFYLEINDDWLLIAAHNHALARFVGVGVDLLMRHKRRDIDKVPRPRLIAELEAIAPPHSGTTFNHIKNGF